MKAASAKRAGDRRTRILEEAWVGDAVLTLYARERVLRTHACIDAELATRMSSNHFLSAFGEPSEVEAEIGRQYQTGGLVAAFAWIEEKLMPLHEAQEAKRKK